MMVVFRSCTEEQFMHDKPMFTLSATPRVSSSLGMGVVVSLVAAYLLTPSDVFYL